MTYSLGTHPNARSRLRAERDARNAAIQAGKWAGASPVRRLSSEELARYQAELLEREERTREQRARFETAAMPAPTLRAVAKSLADSRRIGEQRRIVRQEREPKPRRPPTPKPRHNAECVVCAAPFRSSRSTTLVCSPACKAKRVRILAREAARRRAAATRGPGWVPGTAAPRVLECVWCGTEWRWEPRPRERAPIACSDSCFMHHKQRQRQQHNATYRAKRKTRPARTAPPCSICHLPIPWGGTGTIPTTHQGACRRERDRRKRGGAR